ncbi:MAG: hypothetical protein ACJA04_001138 [Cellvibrionaceae bacterium]|jgi:hypothetical protein
MDEQTNTENKADSRVDAIAAVIIIATFVFACIFWISSQ